MKTRYELTCDFPGDISGTISFEWGPDQHEAVTDLLKQIVDTGWAITERKQVSARPRGKKDK